LHAVRIDTSPRLSARIAVCAGRLPWAHWPKEEEEVLAFFKETVTHARNALVLARFATSRINKASIVRLPILDPSKSDAVAIKGTLRFEGFPALKENGR
jgi:hypothetical protein